MEDYGAELVAKIAAKREELVKLRERVYAVELALDELENARKDARVECGFCNDCSMCLG